MLKILSNCYRLNYQCRRGDSIIEGNNIYAKNWVETYTNIAIN
jgi:hypothetical protein